MSERILVVDDEQIFRRNVVEYLTRKGFEVDAAEDGQSGLEAVREQSYAVVLTDIHMPGLDGLDLLDQIATERPETAVILMTAYASVETAVEGFRKGAWDYVLKPVVFEDILHKVQNVLQHGQLRREVNRLRREIQTRLGFEGIIGESDAMNKVFDLIDKVAALPTTVLVTGESGTGKELVARALHERSEVADGEFIAVNMGAIPKELIENQFFGAEKGAYTGANAARDGIFRAVRGGTVFLDEIGELPLDLQAKLLRTIEQKEILPVGASRPIEVDFRLITATNQKLEEKVEAGEFRRDLYYRLNVFHIELPPLSERREDIGLLVEHFAQIHARTQGRCAPRFSNEAMEMLIGYRWPGNVRELSNVIERALILADDCVTADELPDNFDRAEPDAPMGLKDVVARTERKHIEDVLNIADGNREKAARLLDIDPATLYRRLSKYEIQ